MKFEYRSWDEISQIFGEASGLPLRQLMCIGLPRKAN